MVWDSYGEALRKWRFEPFLLAILMLKLLKNMVIGSGGHLETIKREDSWRLLEELGRRSDLPWICMGDFNEILHLREKVGGNLRPDWQLSNFTETINRYNLLDMGYISEDFTWSRRLGSCGWVRERLDRALVSTTWLTMFLRVRLYYVATLMSNHYMLVLKTPQIGQRVPRR